MQGEDVVLSDGEGIIRAEDRLYDHFLLKEDIVPKSLTFNEASKGLSNLGKDESGVRYAYLMLTVTDMRLTEISKIANFRHVLFVDVSGNFLDLEALQVLCQMPFLILLKAERNKLKSAALNACPYLQVLVLNKNQISETSNIKQPFLETLNLSNNNIYDARFVSNNLKELRQLELHGNQLIELSGSYPVSLERLYLSYNRVRKINALCVSKLVNLKVLHLRGNRIKKLDGFTSDLKNLNYINLRENNIGKLREFRKLICLPKLETLIVLGNPVMSMPAEQGEGAEPEDEEIVGEEGEEKKDNIRISLLVLCPGLKRINKEVVTVEERDEAFFIAQEKFDDIMEEDSSDDDESNVMSTTDYTTETESVPKENDG